MLTASMLLLMAPTSTVTGTLTLASGPARGAVVWLEGAGEIKPIKATIIQKDKKFQPRVVAVPLGSTVEFPNHDAVYHNVFAEYNAKKFDLGMYPKGQSRSVVFDKVGLVSVLCNVHSEMSAFIMVVNSAHFAVADKNGKFKLDRAPEGSFQLRAWHESGVKAAEMVSVKNGSNEFSLKLTR